MSPPYSDFADALVQKHPLQRFPAPSRRLSAALHLLGMTSFVSSWKYLVDNPDEVNSSYGWHFQYLTIIGLALATITFAVGLLADVFNSARLFKIKNTLSVCSAPLEVLISVLYWTLASIDKSLVLPDFVEETSLQVDFGFHAIPALVLAIDLLFFSPPWTVGMLPAMGLSAVLSVSYWVWVEICYSQNGWYPYPIFNVEPIYRSALFLGSALTMTANTLLLQWIYTRVNGYLPNGGIEAARPSDIKGRM